MSPVVWLPARLRLNAFGRELEARRRAPISMLVGLTPAPIEQKTDTSAVFMNPTSRDQGK